MIRCLPQGICSWNYRLEGDGHLGEVVIGPFREEGTAIVDGESLEVKKERAYGGRWEAYAGGLLVAHAWKPGVLSRRIEGECSGQPFVLRAESLFSRAMVLTTGDSHVVISPDSLLAKKATITGSLPDFKMTCFGFWLVAMIWRRGIGGMLPRTAAD